MSEPIYRFFGLQSVRAVLAARLRTPYTLWVSDDASVRGLSRLIQDARSRSIEVNILPKSVLLEHFGQDVPDVALEAGPRSYLAPDQLVQSLQPVADAWVMALEGIEDPHQLGAVFRTAVAAGVTAILMPGRLADLNPDLVARSSAGTSECAMTCVTDDLPGVLRLLAASGFRILAADAQGGKSIYDVSLVGRIGLVIGGRLRGLSRQTLEGCAERISLPMEGDVESLTVASSVGAILYEAYRQRHLGR